MRGLIRIRDGILQIYAAAETYLTAGGRFVLTFVMLEMICRGFGFHQLPAQLPILLIAAALCSFLPRNMMILFGICYLEAVFLDKGMIQAVVGGICLLLMFLVYLSFAADKAYVTILTAVAVSVNMPFVIPVVCGLLSGPGALVGILFGLLARQTALAIGGVQIDAALSLSDQVRMIPDILKRIANTELLVYFVLMTCVFLVVYLIRRLAVSYSWLVADISGVIVYACLMLLQQMLTGQAPAVWAIAADIFLGAFAGLVCMLFCFSLDYKKEERLQFEDDDYYYYVKAVPKIKAEKNFNHNRMSEREDL